MDGRKKTRRNLIENETLGNAATIEIDIEKNSHGYIKNYQQKFREQNPYYYGWKQWNRCHQENKMTYEQYIAYRQQKERKKKQKENE